ncbi:MAG: hypothetical protein WC101_04120 [Candidatus Gracilibacteria bacterium]
MRKLLTFVTVVASLLSLTAQTSFATSLGDASITAPWTVVKVGQYVKGMKVTNVQLKGGFGVTLEGKKTVTGTISCPENTMEGWDVCTIVFNKGSQKLLPWGIKDPVLFCAIDNTNQCDNAFAPGKKYRARVVINQLTEAGCETDCDFGGPTVTISSVKSKVLLGDVK